jgi:hypothetical protein
MLIRSETISLHTPGATRTLARGFEGRRCIRYVTGRAIENETLPCWKSGKARQNNNLEGCYQD